MPVKVLIVDDHPVFLAGLRALLELNKNIEVSGEARNGQEAIDLHKQIKPDIVVMDINMPGKNGIEATREILSGNPDTKVLALSINSGKQFVKGMLEAGAKGYLLKGAVPEELIIAIQKLAQGDMYLSSSITSIALSHDEKQDEKIVVLRTKLHRPTVSKEHVCRSHIINLLNNNRYKPFTLVSAGAGYGKSTLISYWLEESKTPYAWISLSEEDNDFKNFSACLSASVRKIFPHSLGHFNDLIDASSLPNIDLISESFINGLDEIDEDFILVLDDYHLIHNNEINLLIYNLLRFPPQSMHLVISTRRDPYLDFGSLRAHDRINEIRGADLCFSENEVVDLFKKLKNIKLKPETAKNLIQQTEGWISGLRMASLSIKKGEDVNEVFKSIKFNSSKTTDFLFKEVISNQHEFIQVCLLKVSILDRFCEELIHQLCVSCNNIGPEEISGKTVIKTLIDANLFTISLDNDGKWYRFHHLFRDLLKNQLMASNSHDDIKSYHLIASAWYDKNDLMEDAVKHAIEANDANRAVELLSRYRYELINTEQMHRLNRLLDLIPEDVIEGSPVLLSTKAFYMDFSHLIPEMIEYKEKAKTILNKGSFESQEVNAIRGEIELLEALFHIVYGDWDGMIKCSKKALEFLPEEAKRFILNAIGYQVVGYQMSLGVERGMEKVKDLLIQYPIHSNFGQVAEQLWYSLVFAMQGDTGNLKTTGLKLLKLGEKHRFVESIVYGRYFSSYAHFMANEPDQAEPYLNEAVNGSFVYRVHFVVNCAFMLASIYLDRGEVDNANKLMDFAIKKTAETGSEAVVMKVKAMQVELAIKEGNIEKAMQLNENMDYHAIVHRGWFAYIPQLTPIKLKLALNTSEEIVEAQHLLNEFLQLNKPTNRKPILVETLILQAVAFHLQNKEEDALLKIKEALALSCTGNLIRPYLESGIPLRDLIAGLSDTFEDKKYIQRVLKGMNEKEKTHEKHPISDSAKKYVGAINTNAISALSFRETEVLKLVAQGLRNKEISDQLFIQNNTVKKHLKNVFEKLDVGNRMMAVKKAEELGLIEKS